MKHTPTTGAFQNWGDRSLYRAAEHAEFTEIKKSLCVLCELCGLGYAFIWLLPLN